MHLCINFYLAYLFYLGSIISYMIFKLSLRNSNYISVWAGEDLVLCPECLACPAWCLNKCSFQVFWYGSSNLLILSSCINVIDSTTNKLYCIKKLPQVLWKNFFFLPNYQKRRLKKTHILKLESHPGNFQFFLSWHFNFFFYF